LNTAEIRPAENGFIVKVTSEDGGETEYVSNSVESALIFAGQAFPDFSVTDFLNNDFET